MKKRLMATGLILAIVALVGGGLAFRALAGGHSDSALAASKKTEDVFSQLGSNQNGTDTTDQPWLGAQIRRTSNGLTVAAVIADSPADKAGLKRGDIITAVDGAQVSDMQALLNAIKGKKIGDTITLSITRDGNAQEITATLETRPAPLPGASLLPELAGIPRNQLFSHIQGGSFQFTDKDGKSHTLNIDLGTVSAVDANAKTITVDLNSGGSKTYTIGEGVVTAPADLSKFASGDKVVILSVDGNLRSIAKGAGMMGFPGKGFGGMRGGMRGFGMFGDNDDNGNSGNNGTRGLGMPSRGGASNIEYR